MNIALHADLSPLLILDGHCGFTVNGDRVLISIDAIRNLRDSGNLSGTLALELWALKQLWSPLEPESQAGACRLAATTIGEIAGQHFLADCRYDLLFAPPAPGTWHIGLLLREWEGQGHRTRNTVIFPVPYQVDEPPAKVVAAPAAQPVKPVKPAKTAEAAEAAEAPVGRVCVNTASVSDIEELKGVTHKLAKAIVAGRPYRQEADLLAVKGMGEKLLAKLRPLISLK